MEKSVKGLKEGFRADIHNYTLFGNEVKETNILDMDSLTCPSVPIDVYTWSFNNKKTSILEESVLKPISYCTSNGHLVMINRVGKYQKRMNVQILKYKNI